MSQFILSCKESRIENNRSFYGCFYLGPFEPSQSITIANTLRRTLLSEIYGLAIVSVEIEGASHEYSSLPGVHESVLDILLNIKEIVLKKTIKNFTPQIGYLRTRGPGVVTASHLRLPPFIQCVDPDQYIATLSHNGFLNIKFIIQYGNKWLAAGRNLNLSISSLSESSNTNKKVKDDFSSNVTKNFKDSKSLPEEQRLKMVGSNHDFTKYPIDARNASIKHTNTIFNLYFKKRRLFLKKLKNFGVSGSNSYIKMFSKNLNDATRKYKKKRDVILKAKNKESLKLILKISKKYPGINLKNGTYFSAKPEGMFYKWAMPIYNNVTPFGHKKEKLQTNTNTKISPLKKPIKTPKIEPGIPIASSGQSELDFTKKVISCSNNRWENSHLKNNYFISTINNSALRNNSHNHKKKIFFNVNLDARFGNTYKHGVFTKRASTNSLNIDAIFNPITKVNYIIEVNDFKIAQNKLQTSFNTSELYDTLASLWPEKHKKNLISEIGPKGHYNNVFERIGIDTKNVSVSSTAEKSMSRETQQNLSLNLLTSANQQELTNLLQLNDELSAVTKETIKHNIILEIWTNGSMHPRDALNQAIKNLIKIFVKLKNIQPFGGNKISLNKNLFIRGSKPSVDIQKKLYDPRLASQTASITSLCPSDIDVSENPIFHGTLDIKKNKQITKIDHILVKKIKMGALKKDFLEKIDPLNETTFLSTYISPNIKSYYLNKTNLLQILKYSIKNNKQTPIFIAGRITPELLWE